MKPVINRSSELVKISKSGLIAVIGRTIRGKILFPKKLEEGKRILSRARLKE